MLITGVERLDVSFFVFFLGLVLVFFYEYILYNMGDVAKRADFRDIHNHKVLFLSFPLLTVSQGSHAVYAAS